MGIKLTPDARWNGAYCYHLSLPTVSPSEITIIEDGETRGILSANITRDYSSYVVLSVTCQAFLTATGRPLDIYFTQSLCDRLYNSGITIRFDLQDEQQSTVNHDVRLHPARPFMGNTCCWETGSYNRVPPSRPTGPFGPNYDSRITYYSEDEDEEYQYDWDEGVDAIQVYLTPCVAGTTVELT